ncbi:benzoyl-CoA 2,3-epoxidase subunit BoxB [Pendulispora albinea]|uniref:Benzoyl-CoA 2,3-epoxidase subunit BoxB n=1 Tax=Pendulispora albinea TaxID=2741071 RepID=A0ABZ2LQX2_9BACT
MSSVVSDEKIPNNVNLAGDRKLQRALEAWQPNFISWWKEMGPSGFQSDDVYLRTAISVESDGWAHFNYVKMPEYRWGIFLAPPVENRTIGFGDQFGEPVWQQVPGEHRNTLRRLIVTQGDTEPASVEQQRMLGHTCPSIYDLRNLFQVNVEEGRHLWAMVYLLQSYFGRDGREEAEALLMRRSGDRDTPRILGAFNEPCTDWLSFFMFTFFTDRDGKFQLLALAESAFDPLSRTTRFMLTEEAHHMFVGETGVGRIVERTAELMEKHKVTHPDDVRKLGAIDLPTMQRSLNLWYSLSLDLFGGEISSNAASFFATGLKGRAKEDKYEDHRALDASYPVDVVKDCALNTEQVPLRNAMNEVLRDEYVADCQRGLDKWNRQLAAHDVEFQFTLPSRRFHRHIGIYSDVTADPSGKIISAEEFASRRDEWLPSEKDREFIQSLMQKPIYEPKQMANWISAPKQGIKGRPVDFEYVRRCEG